VYLDFSADLFASQILTCQNFCLCPTLPSFVTKMKLWQTLRKVIKIW